ncbi:hypothetical protein AX17_007130 [Amanita inopinata Kibby_2008]|nr:hypothetical protein AX17_007130 [Amanita inopinata Kibby_2008]
MSDLNVPDELNDATGQSSDAVTSGSEDESMLSGPDDLVGIDDDVVALCRKFAQECPTFEADDTEDQIKEGNVTICPGNQLSGSESSSCKSSYILMDHLDLTDDSDAGKRIKI